MWKLTLYLENVVKSSQYKCRIFKIFSNPNTKAYVGALQKVIMKSLNNIHSILCIWFLKIYYCLVSKLNPWKSFMRNREYELFLMHDLYGRKYKFVQINVNEPEDIKSKWLLIFLNFVSWWSQNDAKNLKIKLNGNCVLQATNDFKNDC